MFTLFQSTPRFPVVKPINIQMVKSYMMKFEESLRNFEEIQKDPIRF
ncbi:hypothetical protein [Algoriphagus sp. CAU 1675]|nr:hypothetical protein [Algoriphagus sp. CAU 1675]MDF2156931.1 hypothetical protein [Algoriphagus sp. CAU 1675]